MAIDEVAVFAAIDLGALGEFFLDGIIAGSGSKSWQPILMGDLAVESDAGWEFSGPASKSRDAVSTFPVGIFFAAEGGGAGVGPSVVVRAVVG